ncbi:hypothetical protein niasHT_001376 [Heterodera trifolii]|uniref:Uncharacterized protein n=1 Tax=Heterodera trifolii TaxID=157864 RepID=A0ABD2LNC7_9BILA
MKLQSPLLPLFFIQIFFQFLADKSIGIPSYQWDSADSVQNVHTFAKFINDIYTYSKKKPIIFNLTFVKYASEIATFRVLDNKIGEGEAMPNLNVIKDEPVNEFLGILHYDQKLGHQIAKAYNDTVFTNSQISKEVVNQILQLTFSLAIRIVLCVVYENYFTDFHDVGGWQLEQLLSAFKSLSAQRDGTNENGIFPFQIIRIDAEENEHFWTEIGADIVREQQFIENFTFMLKLSEFTLSYYEIYKVLERILKRLSNNGNSSDEIEEHPAKFYTFMEQYFNSKLTDSSESMNVQTLSKTDCAFVHLGTALLHRFEYHLIEPISDALSDFKNLISEREKECGTKAHKIFRNTNDNTPKERC